MNKTTKIIDKPKTDKRVLIKINELLEQKKIFYSDIARGLGFKAEYGSPLMRGKRGLSINHLIKIAEILDVSPASLLPGENPKSKPDFEEYIRNIIREELEKALKKK